jgi:putative acetyltransferase
VTLVRVERSPDVPAIRAVNERAFGQPTEADIVDRLQRARSDRLSLVAEDNGRVVGHILFTPAIVESVGRRVVGMGLAPMAVIPERQRQGIGSALVERGLEMVRECGCPFVIVVGHPDFYPHFGFERASAHGLASQWEGVPDEAFMALILDRHAMEGVSGIVHYRDEFDEAA